MNVHGSIIQASKEVETSQTFINCLREKQNLIYGILFGSKKKTNYGYKPQCASHKKTHNV